MQIYAVEAERTDFVITFVRLVAKQPVKISLSLNNGWTKTPYMFLPSGARAISSIHTSH